ncbi:hypothetical protein [Candidatus Uabimicrobium amorphum]|uniref:Peptidase metallopeptidase domain-containing protein n=1 Tax=Uabimicrobium amorphum TaxID=2596890 RepID=A0A5S9IQF0_UABAM|nr:hypothetical protein [Candidatus Uabimicrobium amorphum]BBM86203.1 hypothetical protein UABAM_04589 [Candidatus Uabimicrobium amorphum]
MWKFFLFVLFWSTTLFAQGLCGTIDSDGEGFTQQKHQEKTSGLSLIGDASKLWPQDERVLHVRFVGIRNTILEQQIQKVVENSWEKCCGINFIFDNDKDAQITVKITYSEGYSSSIGTDSKLSKPSMRLSFYRYDKKSKKAILKKGVLKKINGEKVIRYDSYFYRKVVHEFGHAMGFKHEQQSPNLNIDWDEEKVIKYYKDTNSWDENKTRRNVLKKLEDATIRRVYGNIDENSGTFDGVNRQPFQSETVEIMNVTTAFDPHSVMCYEIHFPLAKNPNKHLLGVLNGKYQQDLEDNYISTGIRNAFHKQKLAIDEEASILESDDAFYIITNIGDVRYTLIYNSESEDFDIYPWWGDRYTLSTVDRYFANRLYPYSRESDNNRFIEREVERAFDEILSRAPNNDEQKKFGKYMGKYGLLEMRYSVSEKATTLLKKKYRSYHGSEANDEFIENSRQLLVEGEMDQIVKRLSTTMHLRSRDQIAFDKSLNVEGVKNIHIGDNFQAFAGEKMYFTAGRRIVLKSGFRAEVGSNVVVKIYK